MRGASTLNSSALKPQSVGVQGAHRKRSVRRKIKFLRWPHEEEKRPQFVRERIPVLWVVEPNVEPPQCADPLEDWVRPPVQQRDVDVRAACLAERLRNEEVPVVSVDNILYTREVRLPLADSEAAIMTALVENFQRVVSRKRLTECGWGNGSYQHRNALDLRILRLRRRIAPLKLEITTVWGHGYMLETSCSM